MVQQYVATRKCPTDAEQFLDFYTANGWVQGKQGKPIKDWQAAVRNWEKNHGKFGPSPALTEAERDRIATGS